MILQESCSLFAGTFMMPARVGSGYISDTGPVTNTPDSYTSEEYWTWHSNKVSPSVLSKDGGG